MPKTYRYTVAEILDRKLETPLPLEVIPNHMGINLCAVEALRWVQRADGQLVSFSIDFVPGLSLCKHCGDIIKIDDPQHVEDHPEHCCDCFDLSHGMPIEAVNKERAAKG